MRTALTGWMLAAGLMAACAPDVMPEAQDGQALYLEYCAACHGDAGRGDGPLARTTAKAPRDLTMIALASEGDFPRVRIMSVIDGYARSDRISPDMPEFGWLMEGDLVPFDSGDGVMTPTPWKLVALLEYIETIQQTR